MATKLTTIKSVIEKQELSPKLSKIVGALKLPEDFDEKKALENRFYEAKY